MAMLAQEVMDASALARLGHAGGPAIEVSGFEHAQELVRQGQGFILVLNHFDRLLTSPIALALRGVSLNALTMPVIENNALGQAQRDFLVRKVESFTRITRGVWRTSAEAMRPVHAGLR
ncbi:MAG: hypothetical protein EOO27_28490, partial [Comamonadaceae bacterium]